MGERLDAKTFPFRKDQILAQIKSAMSIAYFRSQPEADRKKFYKEWHMALIYLSRTVGAMKFMNEGYVAPQKKTAKAKKKFPKALIVVIVLAVLGIAALAYFMGWV